MNFAMHRVAIDDHQAVGTCDSVITLTQRLWLYPAHLASPYRTPGAFGPEGSSISPGIVTE